jgi:hypothetical protein
MQNMSIYEDATVSLVVREAIISLVIITQANFYLTTQIRGTVVTLEKLFSEALNEWRIVCGQCHAFVTDSTEKAQGLRA